MNRYRVYGVDTINPLRCFDSMEDAKQFCRKGLRKWSKTIRDAETGRTVYKAWKNNNGAIVERVY